MSTSGLNISRIIVAELLTSGLNISSIIVAELLCLLLD